MGRKLDMLLGRTTSRRMTSKLKPLLGLAVSRLAVLRNHRQVRCNQARGDVAQLLRLGHVDRALLRVEHAISEQNMFDVFSMLDHYCHLLTEKILLLDQKECPDELREAISSIIFAASRCVGLPELEKARGIFSSKYGKEFVSAAVELRNNCCVDPKMIQKLSTRQPSLEIRQRVTKEIAAENGIHVEFDDASSEIAESLIQEESAENPPSNLIEEESNSGKNLSARSHHRKYEDVATAATDAFEAAAFAAAAARAAVELCRSESQAKGSGDVVDVHGCQERSEIKTCMAENQNCSSETEIKAKQSDLLRENFNKHVRGPSSSTSDCSEEEEEDDDDEIRYGEKVNLQDLRAGKKSMSVRTQRG
ncbi:hypothetical protein Cni_G21415 [Canna indica]|uniref:Regulator of Vps4 activity in the MVB pathway protein n=1 Tax=Canna indica TaxID=4628 RepID=A0AAQ3KPG5_9LILI|nr:hypothetical protein Cni_G21415 [Canna indica]